MVCTQRILALTKICLKPAPRITKSIQMHKFRRVIDERKGRANCELRTSEHKNGGLRKLEPVNQQVLHALGIVDTTFQLVPRVPVRDPADHGPLVAVGRRGLTGRRVVVRRRRSRWGVVLAVAGGGSCSVRRWWSAASRRVGDASDGLAYGAAYGVGSWREL